MKVSDLIQELLKMPQDARVIVNYKFLTDIEYFDATYVLDEEEGYIVDSGVVLE